MLSFAIIAESLSGLIEQAHLADTQPKINRLVFVDSADIEDDHALFIGPADHFLPNRSYKNMISFGKNKLIDEYISVGTSNVLVLKENVIYTAVINQIVTLLHEANAQNFTQLFTCFSCDDLYSIIESISNHWDCPVVWLDSTMNIRAYYPIEIDPQEMWILCRKELEKQSVDLDDPSFSSKRISLGDRTGFLIKLNKDDRLYGYLLLCDFRSEQDTLIQQIAFQFSGWLRTHRTIFFDEKITFGTFIIEIITGARFYPSKTRALLSLANWSYDDSYYFIKVLSQSEYASEENVVSYLEEISKTLSIRFVFYKGAGYGIINRSKSNNLYREDYIKKYRHLISYYNVVTGFSDVFTGFEYIYDCIHQPDIALQYGTQFNPIHTAHPYDFYAQYEIIHLLSSHTNLEQFIHPVIRLLDEHDSKYGTDYITTVYAYLNEDRKIQAAANFLGIHKNSLQKRLEKIRSLTSFDLNSSFRTTHLRLSCSIVRHNRLMSNKAISNLPELPI